MKKFLFFSSAVAALFLFSCQNNDKNARIEVWLTDLPGDYQQVNIDLQGVEINASETEGAGGWRSLDVTPNVYNLIDLANGNETFLGDLDLPGGRISQIRLTLGNNNGVREYLKLVMGLFLPYQFLVHQV